MLEKLISIYRIEYLYPKKSAAIIGSMDIEVTDSPVLFAFSNSFLIEKFKARTLQINRINERSLNVISIENYCNYFSLLKRIILHSH